MIQIIALIDLMERPVLGILSLPPGEIRFAIQLTNRHYDSISNFFHFRNCFSLSYKEKETAKKFRKVN